MKCRSLHFPSLFYAGYQGLKNRPKCNFCVKGLNVYCDLEIHMEDHKVEKKQDMQLHSVHLESTSYKHKTTTVVNKNNYERECE